MGYRDGYRWKIPAWMKPYMGYFTNTGGNDVQELMNDHTDPQVNIARSTIAAMVKAQAAMLTKLHEDGKLR